MESNCSRPPPLCRLAGRWLGECLKEIKREDNSEKKQADNLTKMKSKDWNRAGWQKRKKSQLRKMQVRKLVMLGGVVGDALFFSWW